MIQLTMCYQPNVLVSPSGEPVLADFGLSRMGESLRSTGYYSTVIAKASVRWVPHEYYDMEDQDVFRANPESDVWSFGMTLLVCFSSNFTKNTISFSNSGTYHLKGAIFGDSERGRCE